MADGMQDAGWTYDEDEGTITLDGLELIDSAQLLEKDDITWGKVRELFTRLEVDPDRLLKGEEIELPEVPSVQATQEVFDLLVVNSDEYPPVAQMQFVRAKCLLAVLIDHFTHASSMSSAARIGS